MAAPGVVSASGGICTGAIASLQLSASQEHAGIIGWVRASHLTTLYGLLAIPTFAPLLLMMTRFYRRDGRRFEVAVVLICFLITLPGMAVLFYVGSDWGRWVHLQAICLMLLGLMIERRAVVLSPETEPVKRRFLFHAAATLAVMVYLTVWTLPAIGTGYQNQGYLSLVSPKYNDAMHDIRSSVAKGLRRTI